MPENQNHVQAEASLEVAASYSAKAADDDGLLGFVFTACARAIVFALRDVAAAIREGHKES